MRIVTADVFTPGSALPEVVTLTHTGNGIYSGTFANTSATGTYTIVAHATGLVPSSQTPFFREAEQSVYVAPPFLNTVIFAQNKVSIGKSSEVVSGNILVNRDAAPGAPGVELSIGQYARTPADYYLKADRISVAGGAVVGGDVYFNSLTNSGTISGTSFTPLELPVGAFPPFMDADPAVMTTPAFNVPGGTIDTLPPGTYGNVTVNSLAILYLQPGTYHMRSLKIGPGALCSFRGPGKSEVRIADGLTVDKLVYVGPAYGSTLTPSDIVFYVAKINGSGGTTAIGMVGGGEGVSSSGGSGSTGSPYAVTVGSLAILAANVVAPNGTIMLNSFTYSVGAFFGNEVIVGPNAKVALGSAFDESVPRSAPTPDGEEGGDDIAAELPVEFGLSQNYPNPFNPTTVIRFALPEAASVSLVVYNTFGEEVARLVDGERPAGYHEVSWNGRNMSGSQVATGVYFYRINAGTFQSVRKMVFMK